MPQKSTRCTLFSCSRALAIFCFGLPVAVRAAEPTGLSLADIRVRDPFIYAHPETNTYYLYAATENRLKDPQPGLGVEVYQSKDLARWTGPSLVYRRPEGFWGGKEIWAPEMHRLGDRYYLFVTFNGRQGGRGTQILRSDSPEGPFEAFSDGASTPPEQTCLDGTPFVDPNGTHWLVYCHEWVQIGNGAIRAVRMKPDWSAREGEPVLLFQATSAPWVRSLGPHRLRAGQDNYVTDGPFLHRASNGPLLMLWSSFGQEGYAVGVAASVSGRIEGPWVQLPDPLFARDGGHCMLFRSFDGQLKLVLHQPNGGGLERAQLFDLDEEGGRLWLRRCDRVGYLFAYMAKDDYWRLRYAISRDGRRWTPLNGGRRIIDDYIGHPDICRGHDGRFYLIGNITRNHDIRLWASSDLVSWKPHGDLRPDPSKTEGFTVHSADHGAPKIYFDEATKTYLVTWHTSTIRPIKEDPEAYWRGQRTLHVTSKDLQSFGEPKRLFGWDMATIDTIIRRDGDRYYAVVKDERYPAFGWPTGKTIRIASAASLLGPYGELSPPVTANFREAPAVIPRPDGQGWYLYCEQYPGVSYSLLTAPKLDGPWHDVYWQDYAVPPGARHGCMIPLDRKEYDGLMAAYGGK